MQVFVIIKTIFAKIVINKKHLTYNAKTREVKAVTILKEGGQLKMKYLLKATDEQIEELVRIYAGDELRKIASINYEESTIRVVAKVELETESFQGRPIITDETYYLSDFICETLEYNNADPLSNMIVYRKLMLNWFGDEYAKDYLVNC